MLHGVCGTQALPSHSIDAVAPFDRSTLCVNELVEWIEIDRSAFRCFRCLLGRLSVHRTSGAYGPPPSHHRTFTSLLQQNKSPTGRQARHKKTKTKNGRGRQQQQGAALRDCGGAVGGGGGGEQCGAGVGGGGPQVCTFVVWVLGCMGLAGSAAAADGAKRSIYPIDPTHPHNAHPIDRTTTPTPHHTQPHTHYTYTAPPSGWIWRAGSRSRTSRRGPPWPRSLLRGWRRCRCVVGFCLVFVLGCEREGDWLVVFGGLWVKGTGRSMMLTHTRPFSLHKTRCGPWARSRRRWRPTPCSGST